MTDQLVCTCARSRGDDEGFTLDMNTGLWVHAPCGLPTFSYLLAIGEDEPEGDTVNG